MRNPFKRKPKDLVNSKKICANCGQEIKHRQDYMAIATGWDYTGSPYDLLTGNHTWKTVHSKCPEGII